jgi:protein TonB
MWVAASAKLAAAVRSARRICITAFGKLGTAARDTPLIWIGGAIAAALVVLSGLLFFSGLHLTKRPATYSTRNTASSRNTSALSFRVERSAGKLLLTWNRDADVIHEASHAVLAIADGEWQQSVDLDQAQLRDGGIVYLPSNSDIDFQLTVTGRKAWQTQSESVRVLRFSPWASPAPPSPPKPVPKRTWSASTLTLRSSEASNGPGGSFAKAPKEAPQADALVQSSGLASALDLPDAPGLTSGPQAQVVLIPGNMATPAGFQLSAFQFLWAAPPDIPKPRVGGQVSEAQILTQTSPEYPLVARQARVEGAVVVLAIIGVDGRVKSAKALSGPSLLQTPAVAAVRRWVYKPATLNGTAVESETRIDLHFTLY